MYALWHRLAMCVVLLHTLGGCCWHHVHAGSHACLGQGRALATCDQGQHDDDEGSHHHPRRSPGGCHEPGCAFVVPEFRPLITLLSRLQPLPSASTDLSTAVSAALSHPPLDAPGLVGSPSLRLHLVKQVLLI